MPKIKRWRKLRAVNLPFGPTKEQVQNYCKSGKTKKGKIFVFLKKLFQNNFDISYFFIKSLGSIIITAIKIFIIIIIIISIMCR